MTSSTIYYLPGYGGQLNTGLGQGLMDLGFGVAGRETRGELRALPFDIQIRTIRQDLEDYFWHERAQVLCNSFGSYLFLHSQAEMTPFPGRVLLLSPIVGEFTSHQTSTSFYPPRSERLKELAQVGKFPAPVNCEIHVDKDDWQSIPENVQAFGQLAGISVTIMPSSGHVLGKGYVGPLLDLWLNFGS